MFNRLGKRNDSRVEIVDARDILAARRNRHGENDARNRLGNRINTDQNRRQYNGRNNQMLGQGNIEIKVKNRLNFQNRQPNNDYNSRNPNIDTNITMPVKTIRNNFFDKPHESNTAFSINTNKKVSGTFFSDPKRSMGMFANNIKDIDTLKPKSNYPSKRSSLDTYDNVVLTKKVYTEPKKTPIVEEKQNFYPVFTIKNDQMVDIKSTNPASGSQKPALSTASLANRKLIKPDETKVTSLLSPIQGYRIEIKNLHSQVTLDDVYELFTSLNGQLRSCKLVRPGYAEVVYRKLEDAQKAIEEFHGRDLDQKPMNLKLVTPAVEARDTEISTDISNKIASIQFSRKSTVNVNINEDAVYKSLFSKSLEGVKTGKKSYKFSVTL